MNNLVNFQVIDLKTGEIADPQEVAEEEWADRIHYMIPDIYGFIYSDYNNELFLMADSYECVPCPSNRFRIVITKDIILDGKFVRREVIDDFIYVD